MLESYFDESGAHLPTTGKLARLTLGGCIAPTEAWPDFSCEWSALLQGASIRMFHMKDFEAYRGEFRNWDRGKHETFLDEALDIMTRYITEFVGFTCFMGNGLAPFPTMYEDVLYDACIFVKNWGIGIRPRDHIRLSFATHPQYKQAKLAKFIEEKFPDDRLIVSASTADPRTTPALQAADLIAFEARKHWMHFDTRRSAWRYPHRRLVDSGATVSFSS